jgi:hypothetical protein
LGLWDRQAIDGDRIFVESAGLEPLDPDADLMRLVGKQALQLEFVKGALKSAPWREDAPTSVIVGPPAYPSLKDAG